MRSRRVLALAALAALSAALAFAQVSSIPAASGSGSPGPTGPTGAPGPVSLVTNAKTATYQTLAADFASCKSIPIASGTFTVTLVASASQPASGQCVLILNYGSGVITVAASSQLINGSASSQSLAAGSASAPTGLLVISDGANYEAQPLGASSSGSPAFSAITAGTNTAALVVGAGGTLEPASTGVIQATDISKLAAGVPGCTVTATSGTITLHGNGTGAGGAPCMKFLVNPSATATIATSTDMITGYNEIVITQPAGGAIAVTLPAAFTSVCPVALDAAETTTLGGYWDATNITSPTCRQSGVPLAALIAVQAAATPAAGFARCAPDTTELAVACLDSNGAIHVMPITLAATAGTWVSGVGTNGALTTGSAAMFAAIVNTSDSTDQLTAASATNQYFSMNSGAAHFDGATWLVAGRHFGFHVILDQAVSGTNTSAVFNMVLCQVSGCGSGTVKLLTQYTSASLCEASFSCTWDFVVNCVASGTAGAISCAGNNPLVSNGNTIRQNIISGSTGPGLITGVTGSTGTGTGNIYLNVQYVQNTQAGNTMSVAGAWANGYTE